LTVLLDYGMGNLRSVSKAVEHLGFKVSIQRDLSGATKLILPGVGAFGAAMACLAPLRDSIRKFADSGAPVLGICLGQQLLFESSEEMGAHDGLGLLKGRVRYLPKDAGLKVPNIGWSGLHTCGRDGARPSTVLVRGVEDGEQVYFVHSLYTECEDPNDVAATAEYGLTFPAAVERGNVFGCQFHPEKSGEVGLRILRNFLTL